MILIVIAIFFALGVIVNSYKRIDHGDVVRVDIIKALIPALIAIICLSLRVSYFALPEEAMVSIEYLNYRKFLLWVFVALMGYIVRLAIYGSVYYYRKKA